MARVLPNVEPTPENLKKIRDSVIKEEREYRRKRYLQTYPFEVTLGVVGLTLSILTQSLTFIVAAVFLDTFFSRLINYVFVPRTKAEMIANRVVKEHNEFKAINSNETPQEPVSDAHAPLPEEETILEPEAPSPSWVEKLEASRSVTDNKESTLAIAA